MECRLKCRLSLKHGIHLASLLVFATFSPLIADEDGWIIPSAGLNLRETPDTAGKRIISVPFNEKVQVIEKSDKRTTIGGVEGQWLKLRWNGKEGWGFGPYVSAKAFLPLTPDNLAAQFKGGCLGLAGKPIGQCINMCAADSIIFEPGGNYAENPQAGPGCAYDPRPGKWTVTGKKITVTGEDVPDCCPASEQKRCQKSTTDQAGLEAETCGICLAKKQCPAGISNEAYGQKYKKQWKLEYLIEKDGTFSLKNKYHGRMHPVETQN